MSKRPLSDGSRVIRRALIWSGSSTLMTPTGRWPGVVGGPHNRLGFAVQLGTVRFLGVFLTDPLDVPWSVVDYLADRLEIDDAVAMMYAYVVEAGTRTDPDLGQRLRGLLSLDGSCRVSGLEALRAGPTRLSGPALDKALTRVSAVRTLGAGAVDLSEVPAARAGVGQVWDGVQGADARPIG